MVTVIYEWIITTLGCNFLHFGLSEIPFCCLNCQAAPLTLSALCPCHSNAESYSLYVHTGTVWLPLLFLTLFTNPVFWPLLCLRYNQSFWEVLGRQYRAVRVFGHVSFLFLSLSFSFAQVCLWFVEVICTLCLPPCRTASLPRCDWPQLAKDHYRA